jgi:hypothetical protein
MFVLVRLLQFGNRGWSAAAGGVELTKIRFQRDEVGSNLAHAQAQFSSDLDLPT